MDEHITDTDLLLMELKKLRQEVKELKETRPTREEILAIKDRSTRLKAIEDNMDLFVTKRG